MSRPRNYRPATNRTEAKVWLQLLAKEPDGQLHILKDEIINQTFLPSQQYVQRWYFDLKENEIPKDTIEFSVRIRQEYQLPCIA